MTLLRSRGFEWPERNLYRQAEESSMPRTRSKVIDCFGSLLNVGVRLGVSAMLSRAIIATETTKRGEWLC